MKTTNKSNNNSLNSSISSEKEGTGGHTVTFSRSPIRINKITTCKTTNQAHLDKYITKKKISKVLIIYITYYGTSNYKILRRSWW
jgi:hypothetical protein